MTKKCVCLTCNGRKTLLNIGMMRVKCSDCDGEGWIIKEPAMQHPVVEEKFSVPSTHSVKDFLHCADVNESLDDAISNRSDSEFVEKKKRGRPPVNKD